MELRKVLAELEIADQYHDAVALDWDTSICSLLQEPDFLHEGQIKECFEILGLPNDQLEYVVSIANMVNANPFAKALTWHAHCQLCVNKERRLFSEWPDLKVFFADRAPVFYFLVLLSVIPVALENYKKRGLSEFSLPAVQRINELIDKFRNNNDGKLGVYTEALHWTKHYAVADIVRLGRFEYEFSRTCDSCPLVYRNIHDGQTIAFANQDWLLNEQGYLIFWGEDDSTASVITTFVETGTYIEGYPVNPSGHVETACKMRLATSEWKRVIGPGDLVPGVHIPVGGGMTPESVKASFALAAAFFAKHMPEEDIKGFTCESWILNPQFQELLPNLNMDKFQKELYLFPVRSSGNDGLFFIFGNDDIDLKTAPRDNSLRRAMLSVLDSGDKLRGGGMIYLVDDLQKFGTQVYLNNF
ncbi:MAG: hypothetical protein GY750_05825 [Lentisphaerae bacterium]|nr:hypothetical protein [Lentisphaerota bacterium]MCP4100928.1 hypothetical protein [Lentisphaerota bacterium]